MAKVLKRKNSVKFDLTEEEQQDFKTLFDLMDADQDGHLNTNEVLIMLEKLSIPVEEDLIESLIRGASQAGIELINLSEFMQLVKKIQSLRPEEATDDQQKDFMAAFRVFDLDHNGYITRDELKTAMETIGEPVTEELLTELIILADTDKDGKINYEEFSRLCCKQ